MRLNNKLAIIIMSSFAVLSFYWFGVANGEETSTPSTEMKHCTEAYNAKHWKDAAKWCPIAAKQGFAEAQFGLGSMYANGQGVPKDYAEAIKWFRKASKQGSAGAIYSLYRFSKVYAKSQGKGVDDAKLGEATAGMLRILAKYGDTGAQVYLGLMYANGQGVPKDYAEAVKWFRKAAEQGDAKAQFRLGLMYANGWGVPQDHVEAAKWCRKAAKQGNADAQVRIADMYANGQGVPQDLTEAAKWMRKAAEQGNTNAQFILGFMYAKGFGVLQSGAAAADWYYKAGIAYLNGKQKDKALMCVESIQDLKSKQHLTVPNYFLAEQLMQNIYGGDSTATTSPAKQPEITMGTAWPVATGFVVTAFHVVRGHHSFLLLTKAGRKLNASVAVRDAANDIALLEVESPGELPIAIPVATKQARVGDKVFTIGYPHPDVMGVEPKLTDGIISSLTGIGNDLRTYQISVPVQAGNSGGPLLNMNGEAIGVVTSKLSASEMFKLTNDLTENANYAVKIAYLNALLMALPNKHQIAMQTAKRDTLANLAGRLERSVMVVIAR